jgi:hypothetical protein
VRRYVPDFTFDNWRNLHKRYAVEEFSLDPWTGRPGTTFLLVDYLKKELTRIRPGDII